MRLPEITSQEYLHLRLVPIADVPERNKNTFTGVISRQKKTPAMELWGTQSNFRQTTKWWR